MRFLAAAVNAGIDGLVVHPPGTDHGKGDGGDQAQRDRQVKAEGHVSRPQKVS